MKYIFYRRQVLVGLLLAFVVVLPVHARVECGAVPSQTLKANVRYCAYLPPSYDNASSPGAASRRYPVLYFLHGLGDNEQTLINSGELNLIDNLHSQNKIEDFLVVSPQGGTTFYVNSRNGRIRYGDFFLHEFMPFVEKKYRIAPGRNARGISGMSMGGYGALRIGFAHPELFGSVSAHSAALVPSPQMLNSALNSNSGLAQVLAGAFGKPVDMKFWMANSPFSIAQQNVSALKNTKIYFDCGRDDDYGFEVGAQALHEQLKKEQIKHEFHIYPGNHGLTYFLAHLGESLQFHSAAFKGHGPNS